MSAQCVAQKSCPDKVRRGFIFVGDIHLKMRPPKLIANGYFHNSLEMLSWIFRRAKELDYFVVFGGDIGDKPDWSYPMLLKVLDTFAEGNVDCYAVYGNHDIWGYELATKDATALGVLSLLYDDLTMFQGPIDIGDRFRLYGFPAGDSNSKAALSGEYEVEETDRITVGVFHTPVGPDENSYTVPFKSVNLKGFDVGLFSDIHKEFGPEEVNGAVLANPGCLNRMNIDDIGKIPKIVIVDGDGVRMEVVPHLPDEEVFLMDVISKRSENKARAIMAGIVVSNVAKGVDVNELIKKVGEAGGYSKRSVNTLLEEVKNAR